MSGVVSNVGTFSIDRAGVEPVVRLRATGEVDASTVGELDEAFDGAIRAHERHVVLETGGITFIDSTGISALVGAQKRLNRTRRRLALACPPGSALGRALQMSGLEHSFELHPTAD